LDPGSGSPKICGSTDPDPRDKISTRLKKISSFLNGLPSFKINTSEKNKSKKLIIIFILFSKS